MAEIFTLIQVRHTTADELKKLKITNRESYDEVLNRLFLVK